MCVCVCVCVCVRACVFAHVNSLEQSLNCLNGCLSTDNSRPFAHCLEQVCIFFQKCCFEVKEGVCVCACVCVRERDGYR